VYHLYPRLPEPTAKKLAAKYQTISVTDLSSLSALFHSSAYYAAVGGIRAQKGDLETLQYQVRRCAKEYGYPKPVSQEDRARNFDTQCGILLFEGMNLHPSEASHKEVWMFLTCVLLPDVVRWRFANEATSLERFIGAGRGHRRNTFGRLWWRTFLLCQPEAEDPYQLFEWLHEDDIVQITERTAVAGSPSFTRALVLAFVRALKQSSDVPRRLLFREAVKRVRRQLSFIAFEGLDPEAADALLDTVFSETAASLNRASNLDPSSN